MGGGSILLLLRNLFFQYLRTENQLFLQVPGQAAKKMTMLIRLEAFSLKECTMNEMVFNSSWHLQLGVYSLSGPNP